jgi:hypothetical protein
MAIPTQEDGKMLIQLAQLGQSYGLMEAMTVIFADDFDAAAAEVSDAPVRGALGYCELVGTLVKHDLISAELVNDYIWFGGIWGRLEPAVLRVREKLGEPRLYENFEALVQDGGAP